MSLMPTKYFILQLTFTDSQVADFLEELGTYLEGHLAMADAVSKICSFKKNI